MLEEELAESIDPDPEEQGLFFVTAIPSSESYGDMEEFSARVADLKARDLLLREIAGRGAFRRFKDTLMEFPDLRETWFRFHDIRMQRRAIDWLQDQQLLDGETADNERRKRPDPSMPNPAGLFDPDVVLPSIAEDLRDLYGERLRGVILFGSWARGDANPESDIDLLVVLGKVRSVGEELRLMDDVLWRRSFEHGLVITALPTGEDELLAGLRPVLIMARKEGRVLV